MTSFTVIFFFFYSSVANFFSSFYMAFKHALNRHLWFFILPCQKIILHKIQTDMLQRRKYSKNCLFHFHSVDHYHSFDVNRTFFFSTSKQTSKNVLHTLNEKKKNEAFATLKQISNSSHRCCRHHCHRQNILVVFLSVFFLFENISFFYSQLDSLHLFLSNSEPKKNRGIFFSSTVQYFRLIEIHERDSTWIGSNLDVKRRKNMLRVNDIA